MNYLMSWSTPITFFIFGGINIFFSIIMYLFQKETSGMPKDECLRLYIDDDDLTKEDNVNITSST